MRPLDAGQTTYPALRIRVAADGGASPPFPNLGGSTRKPHCGTLHAATGGGKIPFLEAMNCAVRLGFDLFAVHGCIVR